MSNYFSQFLKKTSQNFKTGLGMVKNTLSKPVEQKPAGAKTMVFPVSKTPEAEQKVSELIATAPPEKGSFFKSIVQAPFRVAAGVGLEPVKGLAKVIGKGEYKPEFQAKTNFERFIFGDEPIKPLTTQYEEATKTLQTAYNLNPNLAKGLGAAAIFGGAVLDVSWGGGKKAVVNELVKANTDNAVIAILKKAKVKDDLINNYASILAKEKSAKNVDAILTNIQKIQKTIKPQAGIPSDLLSKPSETFVPSNSIVAPNLPKSGLETNLSPSLTKTLSPAGAPKSIKYVLPSQLYNFPEGDLSIYSDYSKIKKLSQANEKIFSSDIEKAAGLIPDVRIKKENSFLGKIERYKIAGKNPADIADNLAGRVVVEQNNIPIQIENIKKNFDIKEIQNFFENPTEWGYRGVNIKVKLPNGTLGEIQIQTPESLTITNKIHKLYEKWRNVDYNKLTPEDILKRKTDLESSQKIANDIWNKATSKIAPEAQKGASLLSKEKDGGIIYQSSRLRKGVISQIPTNQQLKPAEQLTGRGLKKLPKLPQQQSKDLSILQADGQLSNDKLLEKSVSSISKDITTLTKSKGIFNVKNLNISNEGKELIDDVVKEVKPFIEQKTGKALSNKDVLGFADITSRTFKRAVDDKTTLEWEATLLKTRQKLAEQAESGVVDKEFIENLITIKTLGTDIGRKLQSFSIKADPKNFNVEAIIDAVIKATNNADEVIKAAQGVNFNDYKQAVAFYRQFVKPRTGEWVDLVRYNSMLSSPTTHLINAFSNLLNTTMVAPLEKALTGGLDFLGSKFLGKERQYFAGEGLKFAQGYISNIRKAALDFADVMKGKIPIGYLDIRRIPLAPKGKGKVAETILSVPLRLLEASDRFFMALTEAGERTALEYRAGKGIKVLFPEKKATEAAKYRLFRQELKPEGQGSILNAVDALTGLIERARNSKSHLVSGLAKWTIPFVRTPMNLFKQGIEYSPAGLLTLFKSKNKTEQLSKAIIGSSIAMGTGLLAFSGRLTFGEPIGESEKQAFRQAGRQAYSIKIGNKWIAYNKLPPALSFNFAIMAGLKEAWDKKKIDDSALDVSLSSLAKVFQFYSDQSYVKSIGDMVSAAQGEEAGIQRIISNYPLQLIPYRALGTWFNRLTDTVQRKVDNKASFLEKELQQLMLSFPFLSEKVPARLDKDGNPIPNFNRVFNAFSPVRTQTINKEMEQFFQQRTDFYKTLKDISSQKEETKKKVRPIYDQIQQLRKEGKIDEAKQILNGLSDEDYEIYKSIKSSEKSSETTEGEIKMLPIYQQVQKLKNEGKVEEARNIINNLTDKDYEIYKKLKNRIE